MKSSVFFLCPQAIWENQFYYLFGFLFLVFIILVVSCSQISIVMVYFQLCAEVRAVGVGIVGGDFGPGIVWVSEAACISFSVFEVLLSFWQSMEAGFTSGS